MKYSKDIYDWKRLYADIVEWCNKKNMTLDKFFKKTHISNSTFYNYKMGKSMPSRKTVTKVCSVTGEEPSRYYVETVLADRECNPPSEYKKKLDGYDIDRLREDLKDKIAKLGCSQKEFAEVTGVARRTLDDFLGGVYPSLQFKTFERFCQILGKDRKDYLKTEPKKEASEKLDNELQIIYKVFYSACYHAFKRALSE